jgi:hypothetical protein
MQRLLILLRSQSAVTELENSVPLDVPAGECASDTLRKIRYLNGAEFLPHFSRGL